MIVGALLLVSSVPAAFMLKFSLNGCCGAPSIGFNGMGYVGGILIAMVGMDLIV